MHHGVPVALNAGGNETLAAKAIIIATVSTVVFFGALGFIVTNSPGWPAVQRSFFNERVFWESAPLIIPAFWTNVRLFLVAEVLVLGFGLFLAVMRSLPGPVFFPVRLLATVYVDLFRALPGVLIIFMLGFGAPIIDRESPPPAPVQFPRDNSARFRDGKPWPEAIAGANRDAQGRALGTEGGYTIINARRIWDADPNHQTIAYSTDQNYADLVAASVGPPPPPGTSPPEYLAALRDGSAVRVWTSSSCIPRRPHSSSSVGSRSSSAAICRPAASNFFCQLRNRRGAASSIRSVSIISPRILGRAKTGNATTIPGS